MHIHRPRGQAATLSTILVSSLLVGALAACAGPTDRIEHREPDMSARTLEASAPSALDAGSAGAHIVGCAEPPFALSVAELVDGHLAVALVSPDGVPVLAGEWQRDEARFRPGTLALMGRFAAELAAAPEGGFDFTDVLAPAAVAELAHLGGVAHRESLLQGFQGDTRAATEQLALAAASIGSLLSRAAVVRAVSDENGGSCGAAPGFFPEACARHADCYASGVGAAGPARADCDRQLLEDLRREATFLSEPFVDLVYGAACAYGWQAWPTTR